MSNNRRNKLLVDSVSNNDIERVISLIENGVNVNSGEIDCQTALMVAVENNNFEMVELLITNGANVNNVASCDGHTAIMDTRNRRMIELLITNGADIDATDNFDNTYLMQVIEDRDELYPNPNELIDTLIHYGANVNFQNRTGYTALMVASTSEESERNIKIVRKLLISGADVFIQDRSGRNAMIIAERNRNREILKLLRYRENYMKTLLIMNSYNKTPEVELGQLKTIGETLDPDILQSVLGYVYEDIPELHNREDGIKRRKKTVRKKSHSKRRKTSVAKSTRKKSKKCPKKSRCACPGVKCMVRRQCREYTKCSSKSIRKRSRIRKTSKKL